jgi:hypothetical protein
MREMDAYREITGICVQYFTGSRRIRLKNQESADAMTIAASGFHPSNVLS